eukprot:scaffold1730_cov117-Isochrysis_galbana.AAC.1
MYEVVKAHAAMHSGGSCPTKTTGSAHSQSVSDRIPCRAMLGGMGDVKSRSQAACTPASSLMSRSRMYCIWVERRPASTSA